MLCSQEWTPIASEFENAELGDRRLTKRLRVIAESLEKNPSASFPDAMGSTAGLEGFYRFINNGSYGLQDIVAPHAQKTAERATEEGCVLAIHDTTQFVFSTYRKGFGATTHGAAKNGFLAHVSLMASEKDGRPLGVTNVETWTRTGDKQKKLREKKLEPGVESEAERWSRGVFATEEKVGDRADIVHVADAESDIYELFAAMEERDVRFVIRSGRKRHVECDGAESTIERVIQGVSERARRTIELTERRYTESQARLRSKRHPIRSARQATVAMGATEVTIPQPSGPCSERGEVTLNCVHVWEVSAEKTDSPVEWTLFTSEPVETIEQLERVVQIYKKRWLIEEYFKALKSGCAIESRQVESYKSLVNVLGMCLPIAYRLLLVRHLDEEQPDAPATEVFSEVELALMESAPSNKGLAPAKTVRDALMHLARLGGHLRNNGRPGWQTLGRGHEKLVLMVQGWQIANKRRNICDQS